MTLTNAAGNRPGAPAGRRPLSRPASPARPPGASVSESAIARPGIDGAALAGRQVDGYSSRVPAPAAICGSARRRARRRAVAEQKARERQPDGKDHQTRDDAVCRAAHARQPELSYVTARLARGRLAGCDEGAGTDVAGAVAGVGDELEATRCCEPGGADDATCPLPTAGADACSDGPGSRACPPSLGAAARRVRASARDGSATATSIAGASRR